MKIFFLCVTLFFSLIVCAQDEQLAGDYFDKGDFGKAIVLYQDLLKRQPSNGYYFQKTINCYQQLQQFELAEKAIQERFNKYKQAFLTVELGNNFQLLKQEDKAQKNFEKALERIKKNSTEVYGVAATLERKGLIDLALQSYEIAHSAEPKLNFNYQMALLYGQKGNFDGMIEKLLTDPLIILKI